MPTLLDLPDAVLESILCHLQESKLRILHADELRKTFPLVCKRLNTVLRDSTELWKEVTLKFDTGV